MQVLNLMADGGFQMRIREYNSDMQNLIILQVCHRLITVVHTKVKIIEIANGNLHAIMSHNQHRHDLYFDDLFKVLMSQDVFIANTHACCSMTSSTRLHSAT